MSEAARVLVADDEPDVLELICLGLRSGGFAVTGARDGAQALALLETETFDVVVLDVMMPHVSGLEVVAELRARPEIPQPVVLMLSALSSRAEIRAGYNAGADDYLAKPFDLRELRQRIGQLMDERQLML